MSTSSSTSSSSSSEAEDIQTMPVGRGGSRAARGTRGGVRTRGGPRARGGRLSAPGPGIGKPSVFLRGGKTRPSLQKQTAAGPPRRKRSAVVFAEPAISRMAEKVEAPPFKKQKKRASKKKGSFSSDLRYGGPFGGGADIFGWEPSVAVKEKMPCSEGAAKSQPMRTRRMQDMADVSTPYLMKPAEIVVRHEDVQVGYLGRGGCSLTDSRVKFYASFLAPTRQMLDPHNFVVETARQLQRSRERFSFEVSQHGNLFRGCLGDIPGFKAWGEMYVLSMEQSLRPSAFEERSWPLGMASGRCTTSSTPSSASGHQRPIPSFSPSVR